MSEVLDDYSTPEAALASFKAAHARRDVEAAARAIDFREEARGMVPEAEVEDLAARREEDYRKFLAGGGFGKGFNIATSQVVSKLEHAENTAKFALSSAVGANGSVVLSLRLVRSAAGWKIVRAK